MLGFSDTTSGSAERSESTTLSYGTLSGELVAPTSTRPPRSSTACANSETIRDLPMPGSPPMNAQPPRPRATRLQASSKRSISSRRPTNGRTAEPPSIVGRSSTPSSATSSPRAMRSATAAVSGIGSAPISVRRRLPNAAYSLSAPARSPLSYRMAMMRRTMSSRQGSTASTRRAVPMASARLAFLRASETHSVRQRRYVSRWRSRITSSHSS